ncbi:FAD:protein FMN transferase [Hamadaea sp.]|uniref:FAD:protein FMN transferase n=1 Tax=Hamadaea sp. TaxID=2024425 RepID=UPI003431D3FE
MSRDTHTGVHRVEQIMGTAISIEIADPLAGDLAHDLVTAAFDWFREVDARFSTYKSDSEICRVHRGEIRSDDRSLPLRHVLDECHRLWRVTGGYFDVFAPGRLDPSGYVKGWSVQVASDALAAAGAPNHCVNAGGDVYARGHAGSGQPWRVGIQHPWEKDQVAWVLELTGTAVATSGTYERGLHVIDPFTGRGADELVSVTVVGADLATADAYATAAVAMGHKGLAWLGALDGYESAAITADGHAYVSAGLPVVDASYQ